MNSQSTSPDRIRGIACLLVALIFCVTGSAMLLGLASMVELFARIGAGQWFRFLTGGLEIVGCLLLLRVSTRRLGALLLLSIMSFAVGIHVFVIGGSPTPAIAMAIACAWIFIT